MNFKHESSLTHQPVAEQQELTTVESLASQSEVTKKDSAVVDQQHKFTTTKHKHQGPWSSIKVPWRFHGGSIEVPFSFHGGSMEFHKIP